MKNKKEIIEWTTSVNELIHERSKEDMTRSVGWINHMDALFGKFKADIENTRLFDDFDDEFKNGWAYEVVFTYSAFELQFIHHNIEYDDDNQPQDTIDQVFVLVRTEAPYLSVAEYGAIYGVGETAVRNWLRKGKLRAAQRIGNIWRIPALLTPPRVRGYQSASYSWDTRLMDLSEEFSYLNNYNSLLITQDEEDKKVFRVSLYSAESTVANHVEEYDEKTRERLELMLIANPDVKYNARADEGVLAGLLYDGELR